MTDYIKLYHDLINFLGAEVDRKGNAHISCPHCGKPSSPQNPHSSFCEKGYYCFVCGEGGGLNKLKTLVNFHSNESTANTYNPKPYIAQKPKPARTPNWKIGTNPQKYLTEYTKSEVMRFVHWEKYKPVHREIIIKNCLGIGHLPSSRCKHDRLIVPIFDLDKNIVGFRGRAIDCDCGKWLVAAGTKLSEMPLYNWQAAQKNDIIWIVENPIDALLINQVTNYTGLCTYSVSYWRDAWTEFLIELSPEMIIVGYDNDLPGNGGAWSRQGLISDWLKSRPRHPQANGIKLTNGLLKSGLPARLYDWKDAAPKADIGSMLSEMIVNQKEKK